VLGERIRPTIGPTVALKQGGGPVVDILAVTSANSGSEDRGDSDVMEFSAVGTAIIWLPAVIFLFGSGAYAKGDDTDGLVRHHRRVLG
jgi:hypothetical protein